MSKKILFLSGTRADFGKIKSLIRVVDSLESFSYEIFITDMHLFKKYGSTYKEIVDSGFVNLHKFINSHIDEPMDLVLANTIGGLSRFVAENRPDLIVVHGDRVEALAGAIVGSINNILVAHIEGGEKSGTIDDSLRHSITKLSHIHLAANVESKKRIMQLGENENQIFIIGSPDIDIMESSKLPTIAEVKARYEIDFESYNIVLFHPVTTEFEHFRDYARNLTETILESSENFIVIYPNNDYGCIFIFESYEKLKNKPNIKIYPSIRFEYFLTLLKNAKSIIGNSSAGVREAPIYGIPTINIGSRQNNRFKKSDSIICVGYEKEEIKKAMAKIQKTTKKYQKISHFGSGNSAESFRKILKNGDIWDIKPQKIFCDL